MVNERNENIAFAAIDIGTSQIKLGVFHPIDSSRITILGHIQNEINYGKNGRVTSSYQTTRNASYSLFRKLGEFFRGHQPDRLYLGISSHVSSLLEWDKESGIPVSDDFPIWMDSTCGAALDKFDTLLGNGRSRKILGSFLPPGTNWLLMKLMDRPDHGPDLFLQAGDAIYYEVSGKYATHFSSQVSMVHHKRNEYVDELLSAADVGKSQFPEIRTGFYPIIPEISKKFGWPEQSFVFPAMADFFASFHGLRLKHQEGFILGSTSEITGIYSEKELSPSANFVTFPFSYGNIQYGSTNTGTNTITWFFNNILGKKLSTSMLDDLTSEAKKLDPEDTPVFLPYISGERAPFWDHDLKASFTGLQLHHTAVHMFRSILEGVAFARRQCFEYLGVKVLKTIKMGGGSSDNQLWNTIRASILNREIDRAGEKEMAISGLIGYLAENLSVDAPAMDYSTVVPDKKLVHIYEEKYREFKRLHEILM